MMRVAGMGAAIAGVLLLAGCSPATPAPVLVVRDARGGLCASGDECRERVTILADGTWTVTGDASRSGHLGAEELAALTSAVGASGLAAAPAFTGPCPRSYDGQEITYTWTSDGRTARTSSCKRQFVASDPLVAAVEAVLARTR